MPNNDENYDEAYLVEAKKFIQESLRKGHDVIHMPNGDIIISKTKMVSLRFRWDKKKNTLRLDSSLEVDLD